MVHAPQNGHCSTEIFDHIESVSDARLINWCDCILQSLVSAKRAWLKTGKKGNFTGPLAFLVLLYVDMFEDHGYPIRRTWPAIKGIQDRDLKEREKSEIKNGGFGRGRLLERNERVVEPTPTHSILDGEPIFRRPREDKSPEAIKAKNEERLKNLKQCVVQMKMLKESYEEILVPLLKEELYAEEALSVHRELVQSMDFNVDTARKCSPPKTDAQSLAIVLYEEATPVKEAGVRANPAEIVQDQEVKEKTISPAVSFADPDKSAGARDKLPMKKPESTGVYKRERGKRQKKPAGVKKSPWIERVVPIERKLKTEEVQMCEYIFDSGGSKR